MRLNERVQSRDLTIHNAVGQHAGMEDAAAYVPSSGGVASFLVEVASYVTPKRPARFDGDIHMKFAKSGSTDNAAATQSHEASHRYLGTRDWAYSPAPDMIEYKQSWEDAGLPVPEPPASVNARKTWDTMTVDEALNNADSIAGFVVLLGKR
jgi:hypothetical protein